MAAICAAHAHLAHLAELDLEWSTVGVRGRGASDRTRHAAIETRRGRESNCRLKVAQNARELLRTVGVDTLRRFALATVVLSVFLSDRCRRSTISNPTAARKVGGFLVAMGRETVRAEKCT
jgi:hypothetical protein